MWQLGTEIQVKSLACSTGKKLLWKRRRDKWQHQTPHQVTKITLAAREASDGIGIRLKD
jgi:hypothetical protein